MKMCLNWCKQDQLTITNQGLNKKKKNVIEDLNLEAAITWWYELIRVSKKLKREIL